VTTLGEHIDSIITKDLASASPSPNYRNYETPQSSAEHWKLRRKEAEKEHNKPPTSSNSSLAPNERQIIRIAQPTSPRLPYHEPVSPPEQPAPTPEQAAQHWLPGMSLNFMHQRFHPDRNQPPSAPNSEGQRSGGKSHTGLSPLDYVKNRIVEVMRTSEEDHGKSEGSYKRSAEDGDGEGDNKRFRASPATSKDHEDEKREGEKELPADSPQSTDMVIDEEQGKAEAVSPANTSYYPPNTKSDNSSAYFPPTTYAYPYSALSVRAIPPPAPVTSNTNTAPQQQQQPPIVTTQQQSQITSPQVTTSAPSSQQTQQQITSRPITTSTTTTSSTDSGQQQQTNTTTTTNQQQGSTRTSEPAPLLSSQYEPLSDADD
jgi:nuclear receptor co-repressor 1